MIEISIKEMGSKVRESCSYFLKRAWKYILPLIFLSMYVDVKTVDPENAGYVVLFLLFLMSLIQGLVLPFYLPFKISQMLDVFYGQEEKEQRKKRFFIIVLWYVIIAILYFIVIGIYIALFYDNLFVYKKMTVPMMLVGGTFFVSFWLGFLFLYLTPMIYWGKGYFSLRESMRISIKGVKTYFFKILFFLFLLPIIIILGWVISYFILKYVIPADGMTYIMNFSSNLLLWIYSAYNAVVCYLFAQLTLEGREEEEKFREQKYNDKGE